VEGIGDKILTKGGQEMTRGKVWNGAVNGYRVGKKRSEKD